MAGVTLAEWRTWSDKRKKRFSLAMTPEELRATGWGAREYFCAALGYVPGVRRRPLSLKQRRTLAKMYGAKRDTVRPARCPCGAVGEIRWAGTNIAFVGMEVDHVRPLAAGGTNRPDNLQLLCPTCNRRKGARWEA